MAGLLERLAVGDPDDALRVVALGVAAALRARVLPAAAGSSVAARDAGDDRDDQANDRDALAEGRDRWAEQRDVQARDRDVRAAQADEDAAVDDRRVHDALRAAELREQSAGEAYAGDLAWRRAERAEVRRFLLAARTCRLTAREDRYASGRDRQDAGRDRRAALEERQSAAADRHAAQADRDQAVIESQRELLGGGLD